MADEDIGVPLVDLLARAERHLTSRLDAVLTGEGCSPDEWRVLALLAARGGQSMSAVAAATMLPPPTLTKRVDRMVAENLVHRRVDAADRRRVIVLLTPRGRALHDRLAPVVAREEEGAAAALGADREAVRRGLAALTGAALQPAG